MATARDTSLRQVVPKSHEGGPLDPVGQGQVFGQMVDVFEAHLVEGKTYVKAIPVLEAFVNQEDVDITDFCQAQGINRRKLERDFAKYIGVSPKAYRRIQRFDRSARAMMAGEDENLATIGQEADYYDQSHMAKNFHKYTDHSPKDFRKKKPALKSKIDFE